MAYQNEIKAVNSQHQRQSSRRFLCLTEAGMSPPPSWYECNCRVLHLFPKPHKGASPLPSRSSPTFIIRSVQFQYAEGCRAVYKRIGPAGDNYELLVCARNGKCTYSTLIARLAPQHVESHS